ncbi:hypothetical protein L5G28_11360 [Gordonia sp. HY285]|uniref:hypothetical protein n=1 Tax=Gordonia liuliyuniae TaxID=2911517 RepID=UPI001F1A42EB|nr:hypothetical protein [Gordonia liuliyuniae]MCF8610751.1 hypothetical protein [Gordonia liuliyuniae]
MAKHATILAIAEHVHPARFAPYISHCANDPLKALELYKWNLQLSAEFQKVLAVTEVVLRNAIDRELRAWNQTCTRVVPGQAPHHHGPAWTSDAATPLNALTRESRKTAKKHAYEAVGARESGHPRATAAVNHDDMVAQLTFGVWAKILPTPDTTDSNYKQRKILWDQAVERAFPHRKNDPHGHGAAGRVANLHALRNRVSHMEPLMQVNVVSRHNDALRLIGSISPETRDWCSGLSRVMEVNKLRPV